MEKRTLITTKQLAITGIMLAACVVFQSIKVVSPYLTGSAVNCALILTTLSCGSICGAIVAIITPVIAFILGQTPVLQVIPLMVFIIMIGNLCIVVLPALFKNKNLILGLILGSFIKALFLWLIVWYAILPFFGAEIKEPMQVAIRASFSIQQLVTALIGSAIAWVLWSRIKPFINV